MTDGVCPFATQISGLIVNKCYNKGGDTRVGFCDHTAGGYMATMKNPNFWNTSGVSAHFAISLTGEIVQLVNIFDTAWCQGRVVEPVSWNQWVTMGKLNPNNYLISTEHEDRQITNLTWPDAMYWADLEVKRWCIEEIARVQNADALTFGIDSLTGHFMFDPVSRKYCPGGNWPREELYHDLTSKQDEEDDGMYIVSKRKVLDGTGAQVPDWFKSYFVRGSNYRHIPDAPTFESLVSMGLSDFEPDMTAWNFITQDANFIGE